MAQTESNRNDDPPKVAYQLLADRIREQIVSGSLQPGDRLPSESELSGHYGSGTGTAREAIRILASQGLVKTRRGVTGGNFVAHPTPDQLSDNLATGLGLLATGSHLSVAMLIEVRELLEVPATALSASRRTRAQLEEIRDSLHANGDDSATVYRHSQSFHAKVLAAAHNPLLEMVARPVFGVLDDGMLRALEPSTFWKRIASDHEEIFQHISNKDSAGAAAAADAHLKYLRRAYSRLHIETGATMSPGKEFREAQ